MSESIFKRLANGILGRRPADIPRGKNVRATSNRRQVSQRIEVTAQAGIAHPVIFRCVRKISEAVQVVDWKAVPTDENPANDEVVARIQKLLDCPTDEHNPQQFKYWMAQNIALAARASLKVGVGSEGYPNALYPLQIGKLRANTDNRGTITGYEYGDGKQTFSTQRKALNDGGLYSGSFGTEVIIPGINGDMTGDETATPLYAIGKPAEIIKLLMDRAIESAQGTPNSKYIVTSERTLTEPQNDALEEFLTESAVGGADSGNILSMTGVNINVEKLDNDLSDIHSKLPADDMTRHICSVFGVPLSMAGIGASDSAKFANNFSEGRLSFYQDTIIPGYLSPIATHLTGLFSSFGVKVVFDIDSIPALEEAKAKRAKNLNDVNFLTPNEKRQMCGYETIDEDNAESPMNLPTLESSKPTSNEGGTNE